MNLDTWILMDKTLLDSLWATAKGEAPPEALRLLTNGVRGFWKDSGTNEVVNVLGTKEEIDAFNATYGADISAIYAWEQGPGFDNLTAYETDPQGVLDLMRDHTLYDASGNPIGTTPATFENPNWGHVFLGQSERIFAGEYSNEFSEEFL